METGAGDQGIGLINQYRNFDLVIQGVGERHVARLNSPSGELTQEFTLPFNESDLSNYYDRIGQPRRSARRVQSPDLQAAKEFGDKLFKALFVGEMLARLRSSLDQSRERGMGLRLRFRLRDSPELANIPWELLYDIENNDFLARSGFTPIVRYLDLPQHATRLRVDLPLRVLVVIASPRNLPQLDSQGEWERLKVALRRLEQSGKLIVERLETPFNSDLLAGGSGDFRGTTYALLQRSRGKPFHVLHFIGHGDFRQSCTRRGVTNGRRSGNVLSGFGGHIRGGSKKITKVSGLLF